jgi:hydroxypyruvate isomerase
VIVFSGSRRGTTDATGMDNCVRGLEALVDDADRAGVTLTFELLNHFGHEDYHASSSAFVFGVVRRIGSPSVRALYDVYHATRMGEPVCADIGVNADLIGHVHVAGVPGRGIPGPAQEIDYAVVVRTALEAGYTGWWGQEFLPGDDAIAELTEAHSLFASYALRAGARG